MIKEHVLDNDTFEIEEKKVFKFQVIEFILFGFFCLLLLLNRSTNISIFNDLMVGCVFLIPLYSLVRIYFEYKNELITGFGILPKIYFLIIVFFALAGILFRIENLPYASELLILALTSFSFSYLLYALFLKNVSLSIKSILSLNSIGFGILALGVLFRLESWPYAHILLFVGFGLTIISLPIFGLILRMKPTQKEGYHSLNYFGRTIASIVIILLIL